jgi:dihydroorotate dehydrogenase (NAD+) catalytic subunit
MIDTTVNIAGVVLKNPVVTASGTFGFGREYGEYFSLDELGAVCVKGLTLTRREGNPPPRIAETPMGILNSVGLQNPGVTAFIEKELPRLKKFDTKVIANIAGNTIEEYEEMADILSQSETDLIEMNISCPNVKEGGVAFGTDEKTVYEITRRVKARCRQPLIVKLSPNVTDIAAIARRAVEGGADALSLINTLLGMKIDIKTRRPVLFNNVGGLSGPAVKPVAVRMVWQVRQAVEVPIIGMGGIASGEDAVEFLLAGANAVAAGTALFADPLTPVKIKNFVLQYMKEQNAGCLSDICGAVTLNR